MAPFRAHQTRITERLLTPHYGTNKGVPKRYDNKMLGTLRMLLPRLSRTESNPRASARLPVVENAALVQLAVAHAIKEAGVAATHREAVLNALLGPFGVVRCGVRNGPDFIKEQQTGGNPGQWYAKVVSNYDFGVDPTARRIPDAAFFYDAYWINKNDALESGYYDNAALEEAQGLEDDADLPNRLGAGEASSTDPLIERVRLVDFYERDMRGAWSVCTHAMDLSGGSYGTMKERYVREPEAFNGPEAGPYEILTFDTMPDQLFGLSMAMQLDDLDEIINDITGRMLTMAAETKRVFAAKPGSMDVMGKIQRAPMFGTVQCDPNDVKALDVGGLLEAHQQAVAMGGSVYNNASGGGMLLQSTKVADTATEASFLRANAENMVESMQDRAVDFAARICKQAAFDLLNNPMRQAMPFTYNPEDGEEEYIVVYDPATIENDHNDYVWEIEPFSNLPTDANSRIARTMEGIGALGQTAPIVAQLQGDVQALAEIIGDSIGTPEMKRIFPSQQAMMALQTFMQSMQQAPPGQAVPAQKQGIRQGTRPIDQVRSDAVAPTYP